MKRENGACYVAISKGILKYGKIRQYYMVPTAAHLRIESGIMFYRFISFDGKSFADDYQFEVSELKNLKIKKTLYGYKILFGMDDGFIYKISAANYVILGDDKNQREDLKKLIFELSNSSGIYK